MSPTSKSRSKDKKTGNEPLKTSSKSSIHVNAGGSVPANGYNPLLGTFHTVDTAALSSLPVHVNGRYQTIEETGDHIGNSFGTGVECDSVSNNGSWSGESEDHKDKASTQPLRQEVLHGADNDKREKIRQKNEKKHQRQKERRAQELHERCSGYLMSRKLEALSQQLVGMGFSQERATMALILNEGRVEESVAWLFDVGEEADANKGQNLHSGSLKIDISEELARIAEMEFRCKCSRQEVERAVVACEGDLEKAEDSLKLQKEDPPSVPIKPEAIDDPPILGNMKPPVASNQELMRMQQKAAPATAIQHQRNERDFNNTKPVQDPGNRNLQSLERIQPKSEWAKPQQISAPAEKRPVAASSAASFSLSPALQASLPPAKSEARYVAAGSELKNQLSGGSVREPVMVMQRPQSINGKMPSSSSVGSSSVGTVMGWSPNNLEMLQPNGFIPRVSGTRNMRTSTVGTDQLYSEFYHQQAQPFVSTSKTVESLGTSQGNGLWSRTSVIPTVTAPSSLGLFSGLGGTKVSSGSSCHLDWNSGSSVAQSDYTNIDWSLNRGSSMSRPSGLWPGMNTSMQHETHRYDLFTSNMGMKPGFQLVGLRDGGVGSSEIATSSSHEWASPFEESDIFSLPRQFVSSPSL